MASGVGVRQLEKQGKVEEHDQAPVVSKDYEHGEIKKGKLIQ